MNRTVEALRRHLPPGSAPARLLSTGRALACRVRDEDPADIYAELADKSPGHLARITMTLAALVPIDARPSDLLTWAGAAPDGPDEETLRMRACRDLVYEEVRLDERHARDTEVEAA